VACKSKNETTSFFFGENFAGARSASLGREYSSRYPKFSLKRVITRPGKTIAVSTSNFRPGETSFVRARVVVQHFFFFSLQNSPRRLPTRPSENIPLTMIMFPNLTTKIMLQPLSVYSPTPMRFRIF